jgi:WD40 repeat protein
MRLSDNAVVAKVPHEKAISTTAFSADDGWLFVAGHDRMTTLVELSGEPGIRMRTAQFATVTASRFDAAARRLAIGSEDGVVRVLDLRDPIREMVRLTDSGSITAMAFNPDGKRIATASTRTFTSRYDSDEDYAVHVWLLDPHELIADARSRVTASLHR